MDNRPFFYNGSLNELITTEEQLEGAKSIEWTDEVRKNIGINPYSIEK